MSPCLLTQLKTVTEPQTDTPFKILIMGDFSGRANRGVETDGSDLDRRRFFNVDRDNDEAVMEKMNVSVRLQTGGNTSPPVDLTFAKWTTSTRSRSISNRPVQVVESHPQATDGCGYLFRDGVMAVRGSDGAVG